jgi:hypothetical protein
MDKIPGMKMKSPKKPAAKTEDRMTKARPLAKSNLVLKCDYREEDFIYWPRPSEVELAGLAAQLARSSKANPKHLVAQAWALYRESCRVIQADYREVQAQLDFDSRQDPECDFGERSEVELLQVPAPKKYPVPFAKAELLLLPKRTGRTADRAAVMREYIFAVVLQDCFVLRPKLAPASYWELDPEALNGMRQRLHKEIAERFGLLRKHIFDEADYVQFAASFLKWHRRYKSAKKSDAARTRWDKTKIQATNETGSDGPKKIAKNLK